jgi:phospholipid/cholesterol/gamma-HCH transport system substrate-binding protein
MKFSKIFWLGIIVSIAVVTFISGFLFLQDISFSKSNYRFTVIFENVQGLNEGDSVTMLGKRIGRVNKTKIIGQKIAVELSIDNAFALRIPVDSKIEVRNESLLGEKYIAIDPGIDEKYSIIAGDTVEGEREVDLSEIAPGIVPLTQDLAAFARRLKAVLGDEEISSIQNTINNIDEFTEHIKLFMESSQDLLSDENKENLSQTLTNFRETSKSFKNSASDFSITSSQISSRIKIELQELSGIMDDFKLFSQRSSDMSNIVDSLMISVSSIKRSSKDFEIFTKKANHLIDGVSKNKGTLMKLLHDESIYQNIDSLILKLNYIVDDFDRNPTKYLKAYFKAKRDE